MVDMAPKTRQERNEYAREWRARNADRVRAQARARYAANPEALREKARIRSAVWYAANRESARLESKARRGANPEKSRSQAKAWRATNPERARDLHLKRYGITGAQWDAMFESQGCACASCGSVDPCSKKGWHTDHDHSTGAVRGILCNHCNVALGRMGDSLAGVVRVAAQLSRYLAGTTNQDSLPASAGVLLCI